MAFGAGVWVVASVLLAASVCFAAADATAEHDIEQLLTKVEDQIDQGHALSPVEDSGMNTWIQLLRIYAVVPDSPRLHSLLVGFRARILRREAEARTKGSVEVAGDLALFADQAGRLLRLSDPAAPAAQGPEKPAPNDPPKPEIAAVDTGPRSVEGKAEANGAKPPRIAPAEAPPAPAASPRLEEAATGPVTPAPSPPAGKTDTDTAAIASGVPDAPVTTREQAAEIFAARGDAMLAVKDVWTARKFYDYAAKFGSTRGVIALARTYDPAFLATVGVPAPAVQTLLATAPGDQITEPPAVPSPAPPRRRRPSRSSHENGDDSSKTAAPAARDAPTPAAEVETPQR
jgi:hypothetical protein